MLTIYCNVFLQNFPATCNTPHNSLTVLKKTKSFPNNSIIVSLNVKALCSSNPQSDEIKACANFIIKDGFHSMEVSNITKVIDFILQHNYLKFDDESYIQTHGTAMG